jgi:hypothetical protein
VEVQNLVEFYNRLNEITHLGFEIPPTHVTLFTRGSDEFGSKRGIGVDTWQDFEYLKPVELDCSAKKEVNDYK